LLPLLRHGSDAPIAPLGRLRHLPRDPRLAICKVDRAAKMMIYQYII
jgi:hypothetical protein